MLQVRIFTKFIFLCSLLLIAGFASAQFASKVVDYTPAPGQFTNAENIGTPTAANSIAGTNKGMVSLGAFGGSVTVYFADGIKNDPANPYGVDFTVYGNATLTWSEPGIIQVMKDENHNGLPDDTWYEIAGSEHFWNSTNSTYAVTYQNNGLNVAGDVRWADNQSATGVVPLNSFHQQPYYPRADLFPLISADKYSLSGTRLTSPIDISVPGSVISNHKAFGYADNTPVLSYTEKLPDNPYTAIVEGSGGDAIDIGWAVDASKKLVTLDEIHFVRIYTGMNAVAGWLGEVSTEITGIRDVEPATVTGTQSAVVIKELPRKISVGQSADLNALLFVKGILQPNSSITWTVNDQQIAAIQNGKLVAKSAGNVIVRATSANDQTIYSETEVIVFAISKAEITLTTSSVKVNDKLQLSGILLDNSGNTLTGINTNWKFRNTQLAEIVSVDGAYYLLGKQAGKSRLRFEVADNPLVADSVEIEVFPESVQKKVFVSVKTEDETIIPRQSVWVEQVDLTSKVDHAAKQYGLSEISYVSLAHVVAAALKNAGQSADWAFRDDAQGGSALYLWKVPEVEDGSTVYTFGYGGSRTADSYRKTWVVMLNQQPVVTGLDKIKVNNDDEILIYHIPDNNLSWTVSQLTTSSDSVNIGEKVEIQLKKYTCTMDAERNVAINASEVMANQTVSSQIDQIAASKVTLTTDEFGKALFTATQTGKYMVSSGFDAARVVAGLVTNSWLPEKNDFVSVYPNPFSHHLQINTSFQIDCIELFTVGGTQIFEQQNPSTELDFSQLPDGLYLLQIKSGNQVFRQKIVKN
jgi:hypothetical protein